jgi:hypothetical protein
VIDSDTLTTIPFIKYWADDAFSFNGSVRTLPEAVRIMARVQLRKTLSDQDTNTIVAFLNSLTGKLPRSFVEAPVLPGDGFRPYPERGRPQ